MLPGRKQTDIPFEYSNNFIILTLTMNGTLPLKFIFDTGAEHTILTKREISDLMGMQFEREFRVTGSDLKTTLVAYLVRRVRFDVPDKIIAPHEDILVLQEDYFRFEEYAGVNVHGILSANVFAKYIMKINYQRQVITLYEREAYRQRDESFKPIDLELYRNKLYVNTHLHILRDSIAPVKLLIDTGAGLPLLVFTNTHPLLHPPLNALQSNIGMGLGGYLEGFTGRILRLELGAFDQQSVLTYFQTLDTIARPQYFNNRNGLIGNILLSRFQVILDYYDAKMWLKPAKNYRDEFVYDRSGINVIASGEKLGTYVIQTVIPGSPAEEAGILRGDEIVKLKGLPVVFLSLGNIQKTFQGKPGKKIKLEVKREGKRLKKTFVLRDLI